MKECKCKCGGCVKKGGYLSLDVLYTKGGYTFEELKGLWDSEDLISIYYKLFNNLYDTNKIIHIIISFCTFKELKDVKKLYDYFELSKSKITIFDINYIYDAIMNNMPMDPFFVLKMINANNLLYSSDFTEEILKENLRQYEAYMTSRNNYILHNNIQSNLLSVCSGDNIEVVKNPLNWYKYNVITQPLDTSKYEGNASAHVLVFKDFGNKESKILMLTHKPYKPHENLIETDCRLGAPGGIIDLTDNNPWDAMLREYKEEVGIPFPSQYKLLNTFIWKNRHIIFVINTTSNISEKVVDNNEIYSRKWFSVNDLKDIIKGSFVKGSKQVKGVFKMRNGAFESTSAIMEFMGY